MRTSVWPGPGECGKERMVDVDHRGADPSQELAGENLHVTREDHEVDLAGEEIELTLLGLGLRVAGHRDVVIRHAEGSHFFFEVRMVGHHGGDVHVKLIPPPAPQHVEQAVLLAGDEDGDSLSPPRRLEPPLHVEVLRDLLHARANVVQAIRQVREQELGS